MKSFLHANSPIKKISQVDLEGKKVIDPLVDANSFAKSLLQLSPQSSILSKFHLKEHGLPIMHFFQKDYFFLCYGYQALKIADEFYGTRQVIRVDQSLESLEINKKLMIKICERLLEQRMHVVIWNKTESLGWAIKVEALPGDYQDLENELGSFHRDPSNSDFIAYITFSSISQSSIGLALLSIIQNQIILIDYEDDHDFHK